jgi:hypothetical protein
MTESYTFFSILLHFALRRVPRRRALGRRRQLHVSDAPSPFALLRSGVAAGFTSGTYLSPELFEAAAIPMEAVSKDLTDGDDHEGGGELKRRSSWRRATSSGAEYSCTDNKA